MIFEMAKTSESKKDCSFDFFIAEKIFTQKERNALEKILSGESILVNASPDFDIDDQECTYGG